MKTIDNQQERLLWWLGGIIDGEGCITINHHRLHKNSQKETLLFSPNIIIVNTNKIIIDTCEMILRENDIPFYISYVPSQVEKNYKEKWAIKISGIKRCVRALNILQPYIIGKKEEAILVKKFCENRLTKNVDSNSRTGRNRAGKKWGGSAQYNDDDFDIIEKVAIIHNRNPQRLHAEIREYKERLAKQDIVRPYVKA